MLVKLLDHHKSSSINIQDLLIQNKFETRARPQFAYFTAAMMYTVVKALVVDVGRIKQLEEALGGILYVINEDKDDGFFICEEARHLIDEARELLANGQ